MLIEQFPGISRFPNYIIGKGNWERLILPEEARIAWISIFGPGGNGGNGFTRAAGNAGGGGAGAGAGSITTTTICIDKWIPRSLYLWLPEANPSANTTAWLSTYPDLTNILAYGIISADKGNNGTNGTGAANGIVGSSSVMGATDTPYQYFGPTLRNTEFYGGNGGAAAGGNGVGFNLTTSILGDCITTTGTGGGGTTSADFAGGAISAATEEYPSVPGGSAGSNNGVDGIFKLTDSFPLFSMGGTGGGSSNTGIGGNGGRGAPGSGGGGGGAGTTGGTGGTGGPSFCLYGWA